MWTPRRARGLVILVQTQEDPPSLCGHWGRSPCRLTRPIRVAVTSESFLASALASYVSGANLLVHGGGEKPAFLDAAAKTSDS